MTTLEIQIIEANEAYRKGDPIMSDLEYDQLIERLMKQQPDSELLKKGVIESTSKSRKQRLPIPMYSLNKVKSVEELKKWISSKNLHDPIIVITPKLDGISLVVNEEIGKCWTRGDGEFGQRSDVHFAFMQTNIAKENLTTFGEAIMSKKNFEKYKNYFANPRNTVAGLFNQKIPNDSLKDVDYIRYGSSLGDSKVSQLEFLNKINDVKIEYIDCGINSLTEENLNEFYKLWGEEYQIDGLVIEFNDSKIREQLGREENMNPAYAVAYKNPQWSDEASVKVTGVEFQVSKQGKLKPVINIEPTYVGGVTISNVTGYNAKYIFDNNIAEGSIIKIVRSGDVIPKHIETILFVQSNVEKLADELVLCPSCKEHTVWDDTFTEIICTNPECDSIKISKLVHFFNTLEVEDFGEPSIKQLYYEGYDTIPSILGLSMTQLTNIEGWAIKSADRLLNQFRKLAVVGVPVARLLHALDVFDGKIGEKMCQKILDEMDLSLLDNIYLSQNLSNIENDLTMIDGVSSITARVFIKGLKNFHDNFIELINISITQWKTPKQRSIGNKMSGHSVCFTGFRDKSLEQGIESQGGKIASGVSKNTTILVVKDLCSGSSKMKKASELGIQVYDVNGFKRTFNI